MGQWPTSPSQGQPGALTRGGARPGRAGGAATASSVARAHAHASRVAAASGGGARRRSEAEPERGKGRAHRVEGTAAKLTSGGTGKER